VRAAAFTSVLAIRRCKMRLSLDPLCLRDRTDATLTQQAIAERADELPSRIELDDRMSRAAHHKHVAIGRREKRRDILERPVAVREVSEPFGLHRPIDLLIRQHWHVRREGLPAATALAACWLQESDSKNANDDRGPTVSSHSALLSAIAADFQHATTRTSTSQ